MSLLKRFTSLLPVPVANGAGWLFGYDGSIPFMSRPTFRHDMIFTMFYSMARGPLLVDFASMFLRKGLHAPPWLVAAPVAMLTGGYLLAAFLGPYLQRHKAIPSSVRSCVVISVVTVLIAMLPVRKESTIAYVALLMASYLPMVAVTTIITSIWHCNYPAALRGRIISRRTIVAMVSLTVSIQVSAWAMETWSGAYRIIYLTSAGFMLAGAFRYSKLRLRGERAILAGQASRRFDLFDGFRLLWRDRSYGWFMFWQTVSGGSILMARPALVLILIDRLKVSYDQGATALVVMPMVVTVLALPLAGRLFDAIEVTTFRGLGASLWAVSRLAIFGAAMCGSWPLVLAAFALMGLARPTGNLAFGIGHTRFAMPHQSQAYMGINLTLMGLRGLTMPFLGALLYGWIGVYALVVSAGIQFISVIGFVLSPKPGQRQQTAQQ
ncbi:MAG: hypothetical protein J7M14_02140 [Planctomycetes bacterium]|nr:hypothetical protein [Planctomycetota bacterium]